MLGAGAVMFCSAYFALGKRPYVGLLIGITLAVTIGAGNHDIEVALWRGLDVTIGKRGKDNLKQKVKLLIHQ